MSLLEKEVKDQAKEIHDKKKEGSPLYSRERISKSSFSSQLEHKHYTFLNF